MRPITPFLLCLVPTPACAGFWEALEAISADSPPHHTVIVVDASDSVEHDLRATCDTLRGAALHAMTAYDPGPRDTLRVIASGDPARPPALRTLVPSRPVPRPKAAIKGGNDHLVAQEALADEIATACATITPQRTTPLHFTLYAAIETLRAEGCTPSGTCTIRLLSDMQETHDKAIAAALKSSEPLGDLPRLDARGITVHACGYASSLGFLQRRIDAASVARTQAVWSAVLDGATFRLAPDCP